MKNFASVRHAIEDSQSEAASMKARARRTLLRAGAAGIGAVAAAATVAHAAAVAATPQGSSCDPATYYSLRTMSAPATDGASSTINHGGVRMWY